MLSFRTLARGQRHEWRKSETLLRGQGSGPPRFPVVPEEEAESPLGREEPDMDALVLPHPLAHGRPFLLRPLMDIAPGWRHPVLKRSARELWSLVARKPEGRVLKRREVGANPETAGETPP